MNKKYVCKICGWVYDPAEHDNVSFEDLPSLVLMPLGRLALRTPSSR